MDAEPLQQKSDCVRAEPEIGRVAERQQSGVTEQQIEAERRDRHDQAISQQLRLVEPEELGHRGQHKEDDRTPDIRPKPRIELRQRDRRGLHHAVPNNPVGLAISTTAAIRYRTASSTSGKNWIPAVRTKLTISAPTRAPLRLPR